MAAASCKNTVMRLRLRFFLQKIEKTKGCVLNTQNEREWATQGERDVYTAVARGTAVLFESYRDVTAIRSTSAASSALGQLGACRLAKFCILQCRMSAMRGGIQKVSGFSQ